MSLTISKLTKAGKLEEFKTLLQNNSDLSEFLKHFNLTQVSRAYWKKLLLNSNSNSNPNSKSNKPPRKKRDSFLNRLINQHSHDIALLYSQGYTLVSISQKYKTSPAYVSLVLRSIGVTLRTKGSAPLSHAARNLDIVKRFNEGQTLREIAKTYNITHQGVHNILKTLKVKTKPAPHQRIIQRYSYLKQELSQNLNSFPSLHSAAKHYKISPTTLSKLLSIWNLTPPSPNPNPKAPFSKEELKHLYYTLNLTLRQIATKYNLSLQGVVYYLNKYNLRNECGLKTQQPPKPSALSILKLHGLPDHIIEDILKP